MKLSANPATEDFKKATTEFEKLKDEVGNFRSLVFGAKPMDVPYNMGIKHYAHLAGPFTPS